MPENYLNRGDAPFSEKVWSRIDEVVVNIAKGQLTARRALHVEGAYGLGVKIVPLAEQVVAQPGGGASVSYSPVTPVALVQSNFMLSARDLAASEETGVSFDVSAVIQATIVCARQEDDLIFNGSKALGCAGLINAKGTQSFELSSWAKVGTAAEDIIKAVTKLDEAGFHGPYTLALAPGLYNLLLRHYAYGAHTELSHAEKIITAGVVKAAGIKSGGVILDSDPEYARIVLGQDIMAGFVGPKGRDYEMTVSETVALRLVEPAAACVLK